jgi:hypothetical protein
MSVIGTADLNLPTTMAEGLFKKALTGSAVAALSGSEPQKFGKVNVMTLTGRPRAEYVGEGQQKGSSNVAFAAKPVTPKKVQVTLRFNEEVEWADEDEQLGVLQTCSDESGLALARALDFGVLHGISPLTGTVTALIPAGDRIGTTTNSIELTTATAGTPDLVMEQAAGLIIADGYVPNGVAFDPTYAWTIATARYPDGRKKYPELGFGGNITSFEGLGAYSSSTVSGVPEAAANTGVKAVVGQWDLLRWGVQKSVPVEVIRYGDPDGQGDLKRNNQIALRTEVVYGWGVMDLDGFSTVVDKIANS